MSNDINQSLSEVYDLIEGNDLSAAERLLKPILSEQPNNADAWWLYAHAVQDPEAARMALNTVLKLDENYPEAKTLLHTLEEKYPEAVFTPPSLPDLPDATIGDDGFDFADNFDDFDDDELEESAEEGGRSGLVLMVLALLAVAVIVIGVLLNPFGGEGDDSTPTSVAFVDITEQAMDETDLDEAALTATALSLGGAIILPGTDDEFQQTSEALIAESTSSAGQFVTQIAPDDNGDDISSTLLTSTAIIEEGTAIAQATFSVSDPVIEATSESASLGVLPAETDGDIVTEETTETNLSAVMNALDAFVLHDEGVGVADTEMGKTLLASVCSGPTLENRIEVSNAAMRAVADASTLIDEDIDATGIKLINCETDQTLNVIGVDVNTAIDFSNGTLDIKQYEASWQPVL